MEPGSVRLNYTNRELFINTVLAKLMPPHERPTVHNFYRAQRSKVYEYIYGPFKDLMRQLPPWAKVMTKTITVELDGDVLHFELDKAELAFDNGKGNTTKGLFVPICKLDRYDPLAQEFLAQRQQTIDWDTKRMALKKELNKVVKACNTSAQLYLAWPQALDFASCFPYKGSKASVKPKISAAALDMTLKISKSTVGAPDEN
jgi:hypothetical protein